MSAKRKRLFQATVIAIGVAALAVIIVMAMVALPQANQPSNPPATNEPENQTTSNNNSGDAIVTSSNGNDSGNNGTAEPASPNSVVLEEKQVDTLSLTSAFPFVQRWVAQYNNEQHTGNVKISYFDSIADSQISDLLSGEHASADLAIINNLSNVTDNVSFLPISPHALAIVYNIPSFPDVPSGLKLDAGLLSGIFNGTITYWNDQGIVKLNPSINLPKEKIIVIRESEVGDSKNVTSLLARYLQQFLPGTQIQWSESSITTLGPDDLSAMVRQTPYSIGYVDFSYAIQTKMTFAALQNIDGQYISPSIDSIDRAIQSGTDFQNVTHLTNATIKQSSPMLEPPTISIEKLGNSSYPVVGFYYAAFAKDNDNNTSMDNAELSTANNEDSGSNRNATLDFIRWIISDEGQRILSEIQYPSIHNDNNRLLMQSYAKDMIDHL